MKELRQKLVTEFREDWEDLNDEVLVHYGEHAEGDPTVRIYHLSHNHYQIKWEIGWYTQEGEAGTEDEVLRVILAMDAAYKVFNMKMQDR